MCMDSLSDVTTSLVCFQVGLFPSWFLFCFHVWFDYLDFDPCLEDYDLGLPFIINICKLDLLSPVCRDTFIITEIVHFL